MALFKLRLMGRVITLKEAYMGLRPRARIHLIKALKWKNKQLSTKTIRERSKLLMSVNEPL